MSPSTVKFYFAMDRKDWLQIATVHVDKLNALWRNVLWLDKPKTELFGTITRYVKLCKSDTFGSGQLSQTHFEMDKAD